MSERSGVRKQSEQCGANKRVVRANERTDEQVAQYSGVLPFRYSDVGFTSLTLQVLKFCRLFQC